MLDHEENNLRSLSEIILNLASVYIDIYSENEMLIRSFKEVALDVRSVLKTIEKSDAEVATRVEKMFQNIRSKKVTMPGVTSILMVRSIHAITECLGDIVA